MSLPAVTLAVLGWERWFHEPLLQRKSLLLRISGVKEGWKPLSCSRTYSKAFVLTPLSIRCGNRKWALESWGSRARAPEARRGKCMMSCLAVLFEYPGRNLKLREVVNICKLAGMRRPIYTRLMDHSQSRAQFSLAHFVMLSAPQYHP